MPGHGQNRLRMAMAMTSVRDDSGTSNGVQHGASKLHDAA